MKYETATVLLAFFGLATAAPLQGLKAREVPQEHSHEQFITTVRTFLNMNNPDQITDPVFGLLGDAAAEAGQGKITDTDCLQQATADQAFTNAKAAGSVDGQVGALIYRALERNTGKVGLASLACTTLTALNPEIAAISQHQDPASTGAAAINKAIVLALAQQIQSVGGDPQDALKSGTFAPGNLNDDTGKGNTCDTQNDAQGCIFTQNLLVQDATPAEIDAAVGGSSASSSAALVPTTTGGQQPAATSSSSSGTPTPTTSSAPPAATPPPGATTPGACAAPVTVTVTTGAAGPTSSSTAASGTNVQTFTGALGGLPPPVIFTAGAARPFEVDGTTDVNKAAAIQRSCDIQKNACADAANSGQLAGGVAQCDTQHSACLTASP